MRTPLTGSAVTLFVTLFIQLVSQLLTERFDPENYTDEARHHMLEVLEQTVNGGDIVATHEGRKEATKLPPEKLEPRKVRHIS
jgi:non-homologous end joining protein Ku